MNDGLLYHIFKKSQELDELLLTIYPIFVMVMRYEKGLHMARLLSQKAARY